MALTECTICILSSRLVTRGFELHIRSKFVKKNYSKLVTIYSHFVLVKPINCCCTFWFQIGSKSLSVLAKLAKVLSSAISWTEAFGEKKKKSLKRILYKIGPKNEPWCTPDVIVSNSLCLLFIWTHCLPSLK